MADLTRVYTELVAASRQEMDSELVNLIYRSKPSLEVFLDSAKSHEPSTGIDFNVIGGEHNNGALASSASGGFSTDVSDRVVWRGSYTWSNPYVSPVRIPYAELKQNGSNGIVNLAKTHLQASIEETQKWVVSSLYDTTPNAGAPESYYSLFKDSGTVGGIAPGDVASWVSTVNAYDGDVYTISDAFGEFTLDLLTEGGERPDIFLAGRTAFRAYQKEAAALGHYVYTAKAGDVDLGFMEITFEGIPIRFDPDLDAETVFGINKSSLIGGWLDDQWMAVGDPRQIAGYLDDVIPVTTIMALGTNNRKKNGKFTWTAANS